MSTAAPRIESPVLAPPRRRVRHFRGILIRNLVIDQLHDAGNTTTTTTITRHASLSNDHHQSPVRFLRRRSTRSGGGHQQQQNRQNPVQNVNSSMLVDVMYSLHQEEEEEVDSVPPSLPIYVSEIIQCTLDPTFREIDMAQATQQVRLKSRLVVKIWVRHRESSWSLHSQSVIDLTKMMFLGSGDRVLADLPCQSNLLIIRLVDGLYVLDGDVSQYNKKTGAPRSAAKGKSSTSTCSYNQLVKLTSLLSFIDDVTNTSESVKYEIDNLLDGDKGYQKRLQSNVEMTRNRLAFTKDAQMIMVNQLNESIVEREKLKQKLCHHAQVLDKARRVQSSDLDRIGDKTEFSQLTQYFHDKGHQCQTDLNHFYKEIGNQIQDIYPIVEQHGGGNNNRKKVLEFSIRDLLLPTSTDLRKMDDRQSDEAITAAILFTCHTVYMLSLYLQVPLTYPIKFTPPFKPLFVIPHQKKSICLWLMNKRVPISQLEYGIFLLNRNIQQLLLSQDLLVVDIRLTLPNLKYLLLYLTTCGSSSSSGTTTQCPITTTTTTRGYGHAVTALSPELVQRPAVYSSRYRL